MSEFIEKGARAVYEADPVLRPPSWTETVHWNDLLENTRQTSREQFKAALAVVAEWLDGRNPTRSLPTGKCACITCVTAAIRQQLEEPPHAR